MAPSEMSTETPCCADRPHRPSATEAIAMRDVTEIRTMPIDCAADGAHAPHDADPRRNPGDQAGDAAGCMMPPAPEPLRTRRPAAPRIKSAGRSRPQLSRDNLGEKPRQSG